MPTVLKNCEQCGIEFLAQTKELKRGYGRFCTRHCSAKFNGLKVSLSLIPNVTCSWCEKPFYRNDSRRDKSRSGLSFCSRTCKDLAQRMDGLPEIHLDHYGKGKRCYRQIAFRIHPKCCQRCGWDKHPAAIIVHHIDRNRDNNAIENLEVLCCNCHAIEHYGEKSEKDYGAYTREVSGDAL